MGEAKRRGTFEQRKAEGEKRVAAELRERERQLAEAEAALTPEQREQRHKARMWLASTAGLLGGLDSFTKRRR